MAREFNINIPVQGLKQNATAITGQNALKNLKVEDGFWSVPRAITMPWTTGQLLKGRNVTLLWKEGGIPEEQFPEGYIGIYTLEQLAYIGQHVDYPLDGYYVLMNDIDASDTETWNGGAGWTPIGIDPTHPFSGTFDGRGFSINGLYINNMDENIGGLFGSMTGTVQNLTVSDVDITTYGATGAFARGITGSIINCHSSGTVRGRYNVGGICGTNPTSINGALLDRCSSSCNIVMLYEGSYPTYGGGLVGSSHATIQNCYATGSISGTHAHNVGGLVGTLDSDGVIENCYSIGSVEGDENEPEVIGGLIGVSYGTVTSSYYNSETSGQSDEGKGEPKTTAEMKLEATFVDWDFDTVWYISDSYPFLRAPFNPCEDGLYIVDESDLSLTGLYNTPSSAQWQMADYGDYLILTDGTRTLVYDEGIVSVPAVHLDAVCSVDGRLFYSSGNTVKYSMLAGEDIPNILAGSALTDEDYVTNEDGESVMPFSGDVLAMRQLGDSVIVYGEDGIVALRPAMGDIEITLISGMLPGVGLYARAAVDGNLEKHIFRSMDGSVWGISADLQSLRLDFAWTLNTHDTVVYDPTLDETWITDGTDSYLLTRYGMSGPIDQTPTSLIVIAGAPVAVGTAFGSTCDIQLHSNTFDMANNGMKRITTVNLLGELTSPTVGLRFHYTTTDAWQERLQVPCSPEGAAFFIIEMVYGQIIVEATCVPENRLTRIEVRYQNSDKRFVRGTRGVADSGQDNNS